MTTTTYREAVKKTQPTSEADIAAVVGQSLEAEGWDVYSEVKLYEFLKGYKCPTGVADIVAVKGHWAMVVEAKKSFSLDLIEQALEWTQIFPLVAMAVPSLSLNNRHVLKDHLRDHFGMGTYGVSHGLTNFHKSPRLLRHNLHFVEKIKGALHPQMKLSTAGAASTYRHSPYQDLVWHIRTTLAAFGPLGPKALIAKLESENGNFHYSSRASMRQQAMMAITSYEADLKLGDDGLARWIPEKCPHGEKFIERVQQVGQWKLGRAG